MKYVEMTVRRWQTAINKTFKSEMARMMAWNEFASQEQAKHDQELDAARNELAAIYAEILAAWQLKTFRPFLNKPRMWVNYVVVGKWAKGLVEGLIAKYPRLFWLDELSIPGTMVAIYYQGLPDPGVPLSMDDLEALTFFDTRLYQMLEKGVKKSRKIRVPMFLAMYFRLPFKDSDVIEVDEDPDQD